MSWSIAPTAIGLSTHYDELGLTPSSSGFVVTGWQAGRSELAVHRSTQVSRMESAQNNRTTVKVRRGRRRSSRARSNRLTFKQLALIGTAVLGLVGLGLCVGPFVGILPQDIGLPWMGFLLVILATVVLGNQARLQLMQRKVWWRASGCPSCGSEALKRRRRTRLDRLIGRLGIPLRRYICAQCGWQGLRIDESHLF